MTLQTLFKKSSFNSSNSVANPHRKTAIFLKFVMTLICVKMLNQHNSVKKFYFHFMKLHSLPKVMVYQFFRDFVSEVIVFTFTFLFLCRNNGPKHYYQLTLRKNFAALSSL